VQHKFPMYIPIWCYTPEIWWWWHEEVRSEHGGGSVSRAQMFL